MTASFTVPDHVPAEASIMTLGDLADQYSHLKPGHGYLRVSFKFLRFEPIGVLRSIKRTGPNTGELVMVLGGLHRKTYNFSTGSPLVAQSECWVWTPAIEKAAAASAPVGVMVA